jgi:hypothetical protein
LTNSADFEHFFKCFWDVLPPDEKAEFDDVLQCHAKHNHKDAKNGNQMMQKNYKEVLFAEGPKVMLTCNLWASRRSGLMKALMLDQQGDSIAIDFVGLSSQ